jgi:hypothetical protein
MESIGVCGTLITTRKPPCFFYEHLFAFDFDLSFSIPYSWENGNVEAHVSHFLAQSNKGSL